MPLSSRVKNKLMDAINMAFDTIGVDPHTRPPKAKDNLAPLAWEYFVSHHMNARAKVRLEKAKAQCVKAGIIFDHEKFPREPGDGGLIYAGDQVGVILSIRASGSRVDSNKLQVELIARGVKPSVIEEAVVAATYQTRPAHEFKPTLVVNDTTTGK